MQRWWDNESQSRAMLDLVDGTDPRRGVGVAVLGFHGIAKGALAPLAATTLVDAHTLASALGEANFSDVEDALYEALVEGLGEMGAYKYSELMVEDMRNRTVEATTRLAQSLVTKGLPWPRAVSRVADVAGVPLSGLGRYATIAATPGLDPLSAADHADRALMEYAARRVAIEADMIAIPFSAVAKVERERGLEHQRRPWDETQVERDALGQFAAEAESSTEVEDRKTRIAERRARRERRSQRTAQRESRRARESGVQRGREAGAERQRESSDGQLRPTGEQAGRASGRVPSSGGIRFGAAMTPIVSAGDAPGYESSGYVSIDQPLYLIQAVSGTGSEWDPVAYVAADVRSAVTHMAASTKGSLSNISVYEFGPADLPVHGRIEPEDAKRVPIAGFFTEPDKLNLTVNFAGVEERPDQEKLVGTVLDGAQSVVPVEHVLSRATGIHKAEVERQTQRQKRPWDESEVQRDALGQFAEEAEATDDKEAVKARIAERRARRERRKNRQAHRETIIARESGTQRGREANTAMSRETGAERSATRETGAQRHQTREVGAEREAGVRTLKMRDWLEPIDKDPVFTRMNASLLEEMGFGTSLYGSDETFFNALGVQTRVRASEWRQNPKQLMYVLNSYDYMGRADVADAAAKFNKGQALSMQESQILNSAFGEAATMLDFYNGLTGLIQPRGPLAAAGRRPYPRGPYTVDEKAESLAVTTGLAMSDLAREAQVDMQTADGARFQGDMSDLKTSISGRITGAIARVVSNEVYLTTEGIQWRRKEKMAPSPSTAQTIISDEAYDTLSKVRTICAPSMASNHDPRVTRSVMDKEQARLKMVGASKYALVSAMLKATPVTIGSMPDELRLNIAAKALVDNNVQAVRLDGIDVYRIYVNR